MMRLSYLNLILPIACTATKLYGVSNHTLPNMGHQPGSLLQNKCLTDYSINYKGIGTVSPGWSIALKSDVPIEKIQVCQKCVDVLKTIAHPTLPFILFTTKNKSSLTTPVDKLEGLATSEELHASGYWGTSIAYIFDPLTSQGIIFDHLENYSKPSSAITKIEKQQGKFVLTLGELEQFYSQSWPIYREKKMNFCLQNVNHLNSLLKDENYKNDYLSKKSAEINLQKNKLMREKQDLLYNYIMCKNQIINFMNQVNIHYQSILNYKGINPNTSQMCHQDLMSLPGVQKIKQESDMLQAQLQIKETLSNQLYLKEHIWNQHVIQLDQEKNKYIKNYDYIKEIISYDHATQEHKIVIQNLLKSHFNCSYTGVPDKEDQGGLIHISSQELMFENNRYKTLTKLAGLTYITNQDDYRQGKKSFAIDLTTPEIHQWVLNEINTYHGFPPKPVSNQQIVLSSNQSESSSSGTKRSLQEPLPSAVDKKPRIKEEPREDDTASRATSQTSSSSIVIKEEIKKEFS